ncbi:MAG: Crp/Fnr family transcriptional regulator [Elusimicrobia bacterium]|nr:Crp/Fnr family transcriptional regulator [Elusimicrobiota bacterium]
MPTRTAARSRQNALYPDLATCGRRGPEDRARVVSFLRARGSFRRLPEEAVSALAAAAAPRSYRAGETVCHAGEPARELFVVQEGRLCTNQYSSGGGRMCIDIMLPGDIAGMAAVSHDSYIWEVLAARDTVLLVIPREAVLQLLDRHPAFLREIFNRHAQRLQYVETLLFLSRERVEKRLTAALLYLHHKFGAVLPVRRNEVAEMAGTTAETAMRTLRRLEEQDLLERRRGQIVIRDARRLRGLLERPAGCLPAA